MSDGRIQMTDEVARVRFRAIIDRTWTSAQENAAWEREFSAFLADRQGQDGNADD